MKYEVINGIVTLPAGCQLRLSTGQIDARLFGLEIEDAAKGMAKTLRPLQFKRGETIEIVAGDALLSGVVKAGLKKMADKRSASSEGKSASAGGAEATA